MDTSPGPTSSVFPFFRAGACDDARVDVYAPAQALDPMAASQRVMCPPSFPITPSHLRCEWRFGALEEGRNHIGRYQVTARENSHKLARQAKAGKILLFHHDSASIDDELGMLAAAWSGEVEPAVLLARDGMTLDVGSS